jgi:dihydroxyacetone kinase-like predicted kinase
MDASTSQTISGNEIINWFHFGAQAVKRQKKYLNAINVFPVADGDTGTNMVATLQAMVDHAPRISSFSTMMHRIAEAGMAHARGNSGIIFASYVNGMALSGPSHDRVNISQFAEIVHKAVDYLYHVVENPLEGTMISVIRDWASFLFKNHRRYDSLPDIMAAASGEAMAAVQRTTNQLKVLSKNKVVDSGAAGFAHFLDGIIRFIKGDSALEAQPQPAIPSLSMGEEESGPYTFCTELLLETGISPEVKNPPNIEKELKTLLHPYGDSLIVAALENRARIHLHTDVPEQVVDRVKDFGKLLSQKADNMKLQNSIRKERRHPVGIITDTIADLPPEFMLKHQLMGLPLGIVMDETVYLDKTTIGLQQLFSAIPQTDEYPTSSQPEPARIREALEYGLENYESLIVIAVSSQLSGTYNAIKKELKQLDCSGKKVTVIDSHLNSGAQGLVVKHAAELLDQGLTHEETVQALKTMIPKTKIYVCLETIDNWVE